MSNLNREQLHRKHKSSERKCAKLQKRVNYLTDRFVFADIFYKDDRRSRTHRLY